VPMPPTGAMVDGFDVPVVESTERWTDVTLEDGSVLRIKASILGAVRVLGQFDPEGNPMYALKSNVQMVIAESPAHLKRGYTPGKTN
jgi:hypothetical protein